MVLLEVNNNGPLEQAKFEVGDDLDDAAFEDERFCFACIDNWATITDVCPFCQEGFQLITCIPVYDTIQSSKVDDDSVLRY
ncbi:uncharacterized protein LOC122081834 isoform X5 [Macadamia integrifolia]|uniref:uncharacterized protein LOC122081834 isoform X5 n=1 Tax=Macadamia integrifolia TaxID=60698 RepID=UPI001C4FD869|nr:uncharacterized protein LOC122081834 isoform X5 [Macadamia integrifolia]